MRAADRLHQYIEQIDRVAVQSLVLVLVSVSFAAFVTILESSFHMKLVVQNDSLVPGFAALLILRELAVVVTGLLLISRVGASMTAEIALMKQSEQLDALSMMGVDPVSFLLYPRVVACLIAGVALTLCACIVSLIAAGAASQWVIGLSPQHFLAAMNRFVDFQDVAMALVKGLCFGLLIPLVSFYFALRVSPGADGVGTATTRSVVVASVLLIVCDFLISWFFVYGG